MKTPQKYNIFIISLFLITPIWTLSDLTFTMILREPYPSLVMPSFATSEIKGDSLAHLFYMATIQTKDGKTIEEPLYNFFPEVKLLRFPASIRFAYFKEQSRKGSSVNRDEKYGENPIYSGLKKFHQFFYKEIPYSSDFDQKAKTLLFDNIKKHKKSIPKQVVITEYLQVIHVKTHQILQQKPLRNVVIE